VAKNKVEELDQENEEVETKKSGLSTLKIIIIAVTLTLVLGGGLVGATIYFVGGNNNTTQNSSAKGDAEEVSDAEEEEEEEEEITKNDVVEPPQYLSMNPKFVVSFSNQKFARFMQFSLEIMARDKEVIKQVEEHMPVIRSSLLMLFGGQQYDAMVTREGKEKLLIDTTEDINATLQQLTGVTELAAEVEAAYFNSFVIQ